MVSLVNLVLKHKAVHVSFGLTKQLVIYWALSSCCKTELFVCFRICICKFICVFIYFVLNTAETSFFGLNLAIHDLFTGWHPCCEMNYKLLHSVCQGCGVLDMWAFPRASLSLFNLWMHSATTGCFRVVICIYLFFQFGDFLNYKITFSLEQILLSALRWQVHEVPRPFTGSGETQRSCKYRHSNVPTDWKNLISNTFSFERWTA